MPPHAGCRCRQAHRTARDVAIMLGLWSGRSALLAEAGAVLRVAPVLRPEVRGPTGARPDRVVVAVVLGVEAGAVVVEVVGRRTAVEEVAVLAVAVAAVVRDQVAAR